METNILDLENDIKLIAVNGKIDTSTSSILEGSLLEIINSGSSKILIDFKNVNYISSAGLRVLLATAKKCKNQNKEFKVCSLNEVTKEVFEISGFITILSVYSSKEEAISSFKQG